MMHAFKFCMCGYYCGHINNQNHKVYSVRQDKIVEHIIEMQSCLFKTAMHACYSTVLLYDLYLM